MPSPKYRFVYSGIRVKNMQESIDFYTNIFGMKISRRGKMPHGGEYVGLRSPGSRQELELNWYPPKSKYYTKYAKGEEMDHLAFGVGNALKAYNDMKSKGVKAAIPPSRSKGTEIYVQDPNGIWIELLNW